VDGTHWATLFDAVTTAEKAILQSGTTIIEATGYAAGSDVPVASKTYSVAGTVAAATGFQTAPGEVVALVRYSTAARTTKNHPIYLFNYYHGAYTKLVGTTTDLLDVNQRAAIVTYAGKWLTGFSDGTITAVRCSPKGAIALTPIVEEYVTHRDFPYTPSL
jgi:hypothetical protein